jgi:uncharacterized protein (TIGR02246 family)
MPRIADELAADYANAWNVHDTDAMALLFHEDGTFVNVNGTYEKGQEEIRQLHAAIHASFYRDSVLRSVVLDARELVPGVIVAHIANELEGDARAHGRDSTHPGDLRHRAAGRIVEVHCGAQHPDKAAKVSAASSRSATTDFSQAVSWF